MVERKTAGERIFTVFNTILLVFLSLIMLYPMVYEIFVSLSDPIALSKHRGILLSPQGFSTYAYSWVMGKAEVWTGYKNTLFTIVVGLCFNLTLTAIGAYFLTRKNALWYKPVMVLILITMYFSGGMVPSFLLVRTLGMYDTLWSIIIPGAISTYNMILLRSYFATIPESLVESVFIDGGSHGTILFKIFIPMVIAGHGRHGVVLRGWSLEYIL